MLEQCKPVVALAGRSLLSAIFLMSGAMKIMNWSKTADSMAQEGMLLVPFFLAGAIAFELLGGLSVLVGFQARIGALLLFLFLIPTTLIFHDFWSFEGPAMQQQMQHFMKNLTIMGGLLTVVAAGAGRYSLDAWLSRETTDRRPTREEPSGAMFR